MASLGIWQVLGCCWLGKCGQLECRFLILQEANLGFFLHMEAGFEEPDSRSSRTSKSTDLECAWHHFCYSLLIKANHKVRSYSKGGEIDSTSYWKKLQSITATFAIHPMCLLLGAVPATFYLQMPPNRAPTRMHSLASPSSQVEKAPSYVIS